MQPTITFKLLFRFSTFLILFGRAWQHIVWDAPLRAFFWDEGLLKGLVEGVFGIDWFDYVTSPNTDLFINTLTRSFGIFYLAMSVITLFINRGSRVMRVLYWFTSVLLALLAILYCKEKFYHTAQFFEYSIQFCSPILFYYLVAKKVTVEKLLLSLKITIAFTFISHGMYAFGYYPRPGVFVDMTINILSVSESIAHQFLLIAGILDFVVGVLIFVPILSRYALLYAALWGLATALARTWANIGLSPDHLAILNQYVPQTIYRLCHGLIPLVGYMILDQIKFRKVDLGFK